MVETIPFTNGYEAWRTLGLRYEPKTGVKRMMQQAELMQLQNKRFKNASETALIVFEIDRRKMKISEIGGQAPADDVLTNVLWASMDPNSKSHASGNADLEAVPYQ